MKSYIKFPKQGRAVMRGKVTPWRVPQLCASYAFPTGLGGGGKIGIVELGGGWIWDDMGRFFASLALPLPKIGDFSVDGAMNNGSTSDPASAEVALDIQIAGAVYGYVTGKPAEIRVYWANNSIAAIGMGIAAAAMDGCDVVSISWGADEAEWGTAAAMALEQIAIAATTQGTIVFAASGDNDSSDGGPSPANVDLPASAPHVVGCGGTMRPHDSSSTSPETVWNNNPGNASGEGTGGGYSTLFSMPSSQVGAPQNQNGTRMVPDVSANADPVTGYHITLGGQDVVVGGTSAVAPLYAGLFAAFGRKLGFINPKLWQNPAAFNDIITGDNGMYSAAVGPDPCSGLGSPRGDRLSMIFAE